MAKSQPFTIADLERLGLEKQSDGSYAKSVVRYRNSIDRIKSSSATQHIKTAEESHLKLNTRHLHVDLKERGIIGLPASPIAYFEVEPMGCVRMTYRDRIFLDPLHKDPKKRQRKAVTRYFKYKRELEAIALKNGFTMPESDIHVVFIIPMAHSWSEKKKNQMNGSPHQQKPDFDNLAKGLFDAIMKEDKKVWDCRITKYWGRAGGILIYNA